MSESPSEVDDSPLGLYYAPITTEPTLSDPTSPPASATSSDDGSSSMLLSGTPTQLTRDMQAFMGRIDARLLESSRL